MPVIKHEPDPREEYAEEIKRYKPLSEWLALRVGDAHEEGSVVEVVSAFATLQDHNESTVVLRYLLNGRNFPVLDRPFEWCVEGSKSWHVIRILLEIQLQFALQEE